MSGYGSDDVGITVMNGPQAGSGLAGWQDVRISFGVERFPRDFALTLTEFYPGQAGKIDLAPGQPITVTIGGDPVVTGYIDDYAAEYSGDSHQVHIAGRGMCEDLVDCSAEFQTFQISNITLVGLANKLCAPFGITVVANDGDSIVIPQFNVVLTETPYEILERVARWANFLLYEDEMGRLVIARLSDQQMASGFEEGVNIQDANVKFSTGQRYTSISPVYLSTAFLTNGANAQTPFVIDENGNSAAATDSSFPLRADGKPRYRPLIVVSEQTQTVFQLAKNRAAWEMARRFGRSQAVTLKTDTWRDSDGTLWQPNARASVTSPNLKLSGQNWLISEGTFERGENGTTADLTLMPPQAFVPSPDLLLPFDYQVAQDLPGGGSSQYYPAPR